MTLKMTFIATTALVLCVSPSFSGQKPERPDDRMLAHLRRLGIPVQVVHGFPVTVIRRAKTGQHPKPHAPEHFVRGVTYNTLDEHDKNAEFISWYGYRVEKTSSCYSQSGYHSCFSASGATAIPVTGLGYKARKISVPLSSFDPSAEYNVGLYSATASGLPGNELTGASTTASSTTYCCTGLRTVSVGPIKLKAGVTYFVEVTGGKSGNSDGMWDMESLDWSKAYVDWYQFREHVTYNFGSGTYSTNFSSPWHHSAYTPA